MKKLLLIAGLGLFVSLFLLGTVQAEVPNDACWGQATAVFAQTGEMGQHASQQPTPRLGLHNLAQALAEAGVIPDDSLAFLGAFVANELGLSIDACAASITTASSSMAPCTHQRPSDADIVPCSIQAFAALSMLR